MKKLKMETEKHQMAFRLYLNMGDDRSYQKVAKELGVSETSVNKWAQSFNWQERTQEQENIIGGLMLRDTVMAIAEFKSTSQKIILAWMDIFMQNMADGKVDATNFGQFLKAANLYVKLGGDVDFVGGDSETRIMAIVHKYEGMSRDEFVNETQRVKEELSELITRLADRDKTSKSH